MAISVSLGTHKFDEEMDSRSYFPTFLPIGAGRDNHPAGVSVNIVLHSCYTVQM